MKTQYYPSLIFYTKLQNWNQTLSFYFLFLFVITVTSALSSSSSIILKFGKFWSIYSITKRVIVHRFVLNLLYPLSLLPPFRQHRSWFSCISINAWPSPLLRLYKPGSNPRQRNCRCPHWSVSAARLLHFLFAFLVLYKRRCVQRLCRAIHHHKEMLEHVKYVS